LWPGWLRAQVKGAIQNPVLIVDSSLKAAWTAGRILMGNMRDFLVMGLTMMEMG